MMFEDFADDDFADLGPQMKPRSAALTMSCVVLGRKSTARVQFNFAPEVLEEIGGERYSIGFAVSRKSGVRAFRISVDPAGRFEAHTPNRGNRRILRCPTPAVGFVVAEGSIEPEYFVDAIGKVILIEVPEHFARSAPEPRLLPAPAPAAKSIEPPLIVKDDETRLAVDRRMKELIQGDEIVPKMIGGYPFNPSERAILAALLSHGQVRREGLLAACHDPEKGEDDRDPKLVDVHLSKMQARLRMLGVSIELVGTGAWRLGLDAKVKLRAAIADAGGGDQ